MGSDKIRRRSSRTVASLLFNLNLNYEKSISLVRKVGKKFGHEQTDGQKNHKKVLRTIKRADESGDLCDMDAVLQAFVKAHRGDDVRCLALQGQRWPEIDIRAAVVQIQGWQTARTKLPLWAATEGIIFPEHLAMEQCSSQRTAEYKAGLAAALPHCERLTDLTGGFGVDATLMARRTEAGHIAAGLTIVEPQEALCRMVAGNLRLLGVRDARIVCGQAEEVLPTLPHQDLIYLDPSRRDRHGGRVSALCDCRPDVGALLPQLLARAEHVLLKLSPMLDLTEALRTLPAREVHVVSVEGECKELLVLMSGEQERESIVHCVNLGRRPTDFVFTRSEEREAACPMAEGVGALLMEPDASVMKAAAFRTIAARFALKKLHPNSHLYTTETPVADFPGRLFRVEATCAPTRRDVQALLGKQPAAHLRVRNFPLPTDALRSKLGLREGGDKFLFATTLRDGSHRLIVCSLLA